MPKKLRIHRHARHLTAVEKAIPGRCFLYAGLGHVTRLSHDRWQATVGEDPLSATNGSVWAVGPYRTTGAAGLAAMRARRHEIAFAGGKFLVYATTRSYLEATVSLTAACLSANAGAGGYTF